MALEALFFFTICCFFVIFLSSTQWPAKTMNVPTQNGVVGQKLWFYSSWWMPKQQTGVLVSTGKFWIKKTEFKLQPMHSLILSATQTIQLEPLLCVVRRIGHKHTDVHHDRNMWGSTCLSRLLYKQLFLREKIPVFYAYSKILRYGLCCREGYFLIFFFFHLS